MSPVGTLWLARREALAAGAASLAALSYTSADAREVRADAEAKNGRLGRFNDGWRFHRGDGAGFESSDLQDEGWRPVELPHDWSIEDIPAAEAPDASGPFSKTKSPGGKSTGHTVGGVGWYRKRFSVTDLPPAARVQLLFDGAYRTTDVWLNGQHLGSHRYGYSPFGFDLAPNLKAGENIVAVRVRNEGDNSRWYTGSGLYRDVCLLVAPASGIAHRGVAASTQSLADRLARVVVETKLVGDFEGAALIVRLRLPDGRLAAETKVPAATLATAELAVPSPRPWSVQSPHLYTLETDLVRAGKVVDTHSEPFGIRTVDVDVAGGLRINGVPTKLRGGCVHHDNGLLGAAAIARAETRRVELLKARGFNAVRAAHNPPSTAFLDACDRLGLMVIDEFFDVWSRPKKPDDYSKDFASNWREDLAATIARDRNRPSVIMWSLGNEIPEQLQPAGVAIQAMLADETRRLDPSRPVTSAVNGFAGRPVYGRNGKIDQAPMIALDVAGYNYKHQQYEIDHEAYPHRIIYGSESFPVDMHAVWEKVKRLPYVLGDFVWTAMDHLGESGLGAAEIVDVPARPSPTATLPAANYPWVGSYCGDIDLIGQKKPQAHYRDVLWDLSPLEMAVALEPPAGKREILQLWAWTDERQSWTWNEAVGRRMTVRVYALGDTVELWLNGQRIGRQALGPETQATATFKVGYAPGWLEARAFKDGAEIGRKRFESAGAPHKLVLRPEATRLGAEGGDLAYVLIEVCDARGRLCPGATSLITLRLQGPAKLAAFGNADPRNAVSVQSSKAVAFQGRALAIARPIGSKGRVQLRAASPGLEEGVTVLSVG